MTVLLTRCGPKARPTAAYVSMAHTGASQMSLTRNAPSSTCAQRRPVAGRRVRFLAGHCFGQSVLVIGKVAMAIRPAWTSEGTVCEHSGLLDNQGCAGSGSSGTRRLHALSRV
jgi:hypothetical protein